MREEEERMIPGPTIPLQEHTLYDITKGKSGSQASLFSFCTLFIDCMHMWVLLGNYTPVEVRGHLVGFDSLLLPGTSWGIKLRSSREAVSVFTC